MRKIIGVDPDVQPGDRLITVYLKDENGNVSAGLMDVEDYRNMLEEIATAIQNEGAEGEEPEVEPDGVEQELKTVGDRILMGEEDHLD